MKKCLLLQELHSKSFPVEGNCFKDILSTHLPMLSGGVLISMSGDDVVEAMKLSAPYLNESLDFSVSGLEKCLPPIKLIVLDSSKVNYLECSCTRAVYLLRFQGLQSNHLEFHLAMKCLDRSQHLEKTTVSSVLIGLPLRIK